MAVKDYNKIKRFFIAILLFVPFFCVNADNLSSASFKVKEAFFGSMGGISSSSSFSILGVLSQFSMGTSSTNTFKLNSGFLYFPKVTSPVLVASAGDSQAALSWNSSQGFVGINVGGYLLGQAEVSGGPYSFTSVGNVTSATRSSLVNGTKYYFIVQAQDAFGAVVATSGEVSATPVAVIVTPPGGGNGGGGGGGGGGNIPPPFASTKISLQGLAYPFAKIVILKDASVGAELTADENGNFQTVFTVLGGIYSFGIYALDKDGFKSPTFGFTVNSMPNQTVTTSDILIAPTIGADKSVVKVGNTIKFFGYAYPISSINISVNSKREILDRTVADKYGRWSYSLKTDVLEIGEHTAKSQTIVAKNLASSYSQLLAFRVGDKDVTSAGADATVASCNSHGDINNDGKINITDFSILMYFWNKNKPLNPCADINNDGKVNLRDFSIMLYWWTGKTKT